MSTNHEQVSAGMKGYKCSFKGCSHENNRVVCACNILLICVFFEFVGLSFYIVITASEFWLQKIPSLNAEWRYTHMFCVSISSCRVAREEDSLVHSTI